MEMGAARESPMSDDDRVKALYQIRENKGETQKRREEKERQERKEEEMRRKRKEREQEV